MIVEFSSFGYTAKSLVFALVALAVGALWTPIWAQSTERVSISSDGTQGNSSSRGLDISADGRFVVFTSSASNLVSLDNNGTVDVFVRDRLTGTTELVSFNSNSITPGGITVGGASPSISADGRYVAFSTVHNIDGGDGNGLADVYVYDQTTQTHELISGQLGSGTGNGISVAPRISGDGRFVAFRSSATTLVQNDSNNTDDIFVRDRATGITTRVSVSSSGSQSDAGSEAPSISSDGRYVAFHSYASNLVPGDSNGTLDVFVHDRLTGNTERVSVANDGSEGRCNVPLPPSTPENPTPPFSLLPSISADGRYVAFESVADTLVVGDSNCGPDIFVRDRQAGTTERVNVASDGSEANNSSQRLVISANGRYVVFGSAASNLVPGDTSVLAGGKVDVFVHDRVTGNTERVSVASDGTPANEHSQPDFNSMLAITADGQIVAFSSQGTNLVAGDTNGFEDAFVRIRASAGPTKVGENTTVVPTATDNTGSGIDPSLTTIQFENVTAAGDTTITIETEGAVAPSGLKLGNPPVVLNINTTATFSGPVEVCIDYSSLSFGAENLLFLTHYTDPDGAGPEPEQWVDITTVLDTDFNIICGLVNSFSPFALMEPKDPVELLAGLATLIAELNARQGIINSLDAKREAAVKAWNDSVQRNHAAAVNALQALINAAQAQRGAQISVAEADELIRSATEIIRVLTRDFF